MAKVGRIETIPIQASGKDGVTKGTSDCLHKKWLHYGITENTEPDSTNKAECSASAKRTTPSQPVFCASDRKLDDYMVTGKADAFMIDSKHPSFVSNSYKDSCKQENNNTELALWLSGYRTLGKWPPSTAMNPLRHEGTSLIAIPRADSISLQNAATTEKTQDTMTRQRDQEDFIQLLNAIKEENHNDVVALIDQGINLMQCDENGQAAIHHAAIYGNSTALQLLGNAASDSLTLKDKNNKTAHKILAESIGAFAYHVVVTKPMKTKLSNHLHDTDLIKATLLNRQLQLYNQTSK